MGVVASGTLEAPTVSDSNETALANGTAVISTVEGELTLTFDEEITIDQSTLDGIHMLATLVPGIVYAVILLMLLFLYPLNKKRTQEMNAELAARRNK